MILFQHVVMTSHYHDNWHFQDRDGNVQSTYQVLVESIIYCYYSNMKHSHPSFHF